LLLSWDIKAWGATIYPSFAHKIYLERENVIIKRI